jgi:hypothetical protein
MRSTDQIDNLLTLNELPLAKTVPPPLPPAPSQIPPPPLTPPHNTLSSPPIHHIIVKHGPNLTREVLNPKT